MDIEEDCLFCKIVKGEVPSTKIMENDKILAFEDIHKVAPVHILVIPKKHITSINEITKENYNYLADIFLAIAEIVKKEGIAETGYRVISNCGKDGRQVVPHLHFHVIGGRDLGVKIVKDE